MCSCKRDYAARLRWVAGMVVLRRTWAIGTQVSYSTGRELASHLQLHPTTVYAHLLQLWALRMIARFTYVIFLSSIRANRECCVNLQTTYQERTKNTHDDPARRPERGP